MKKIILEKKTPNGDHWKAVFLPEAGMNLISFQKNHIEIIDQSTWNIFEERYAGLGALIGPHFHRRATNSLPMIQNESLFPHIARVKAKGVQDPFSHGIARYAPWKVRFSNHTVHAVLSGEDQWNGVLLKDLEGQNFQMKLDAELLEDGLHLNLSVESEQHSLVGIHYYYALSDGKGIVTSQIQDQVRIEGQLQAIPSEWNFDNHVLKFNLDSEADYTFRSYLNKNQEIILETATYHLHTIYSSNGEDCCWQLYHPKDASFVCIEPISAQDPRHPTTNKSRLSIHLNIHS